MRRMVPAALWVVAVAALATGVALVALGQWSAPLRAAATAAEAGRLDDALDGYAASEARISRLTPVKDALPRAYDASVANQLALLYRQERYDELIEKAGAAASTADTHFWAGCALFIKAKDEEKNEARVGWLERAQQEFRSALELDPDDWNTRYNYELARKLLDELRKQPKTPPKQLLQLLRPQPKAGSQPTKRVG